MRLPAIDESVVVADFDTELVVLVPAERKAHLLEPMWALLFDSCRRGDELDDLVAELADATHADGIPNGYTSTATILAHTHHGYIVAPGAVPSIAARRSDRDAVAGWGGSKIELDSGFTDLWDSGPSIHDK